MANGEAISRRPLSPARRPANRRHAQKSTGPKTMAGKWRAALDARRLGLAPPEIERHQKPEPVPNHREGMRLIGEDVPTRRHGGTEKDGQRRGKNDLFTLFSFVSPCLCASAFDFTSLRGSGSRVRRPKQSQSKAKRLKQLAIRNLSKNREKQSHGDELAFKSVDYGDFRPVFRQVATDGSILYIADLEDDSSLLRKVACGNRAWGRKANDFYRTEATDLLKTKDGAWDRTQYEPISEGSQGGRQSAVGVISFQFSVFSTSPWSKAIPTQGWN